jgi:5S rRNA maturation endonuclease (ribonuclease M5)
LAVALRDAEGRVVAIQVRRIDDQDDGSGKWRVHGKSSLGCFGDPTLIRSCNCVLVTEGLSDFLAASAAQLPGVVVLGVAGVKATTALLGLQLKGKRVLVATDADEAGETCAVEVSKRFTAQGAKVIRALPTQGKDLADMVAAGSSIANLVRDLREGAVGFQSFAARIKGSHARLAASAGRYLSFGVAFLDAALGGISPYDLILVGAKMGLGKCLRPGTMVLRYDGLVVPVEKLNIGDVLMGPDSSPRVVLSTTQGKGPMYRILPVKGDAWECNDQHILVVVDTTTGEETEISVGEFIQCAPAWRAHQKLFQSKLVQFAPGTPLPIDPYFLGIWFGDGAHQIDDIRITKPDVEIKECCESIAKKYGLTVKTDSRNTHRISGVRGAGNPLLMAMRELLRSGVDIIPMDYLTSSVEDRRALLAGLLDTDGFNIGPGNMEISQKSVRIADGICFLARSLGIRVNRRTKMVRLDGWSEARPYELMVLVGDLDQIPMRIERKRSLPRMINKDHLRVGFTVESIPDGPYSGFMLDGDGRFLLGDFTVSHNSQLASIIARSNAQKGKRVHFFALEAEPDEVENRIKWEFISTMAFRRGLDPENASRMDYLSWSKGELQDLTGKYDEVAERMLAEQYASMSTLYRRRDFDIDDLERAFIEIQDETDLVIIDHVHYVDNDDDNENRGMKRIIKKVRDLALGAGRPVVLVAHVRKSERKGAPLVPTIEDFMGTSDIGKIATKTVMVAPAYDQTGDSTKPYLFPTYMHPAKCRPEGSRTRFVGLTMFNARLGAYERPFDVGRFTNGGEKFELIDLNKLPRWAIHVTPVNH